jgi:predicted nucleotidyltransferase
MEIFYGNVFNALNKARVKYVVAGGVAVVLYGYMRNTADLDLIVFLEKRNLERFFDALKNVRYIPKVPVTREQFCDSKLRSEWKRTKGMIVFSFVHKDPPFQLIDMFVDEPIAFGELYQKKRNIRVQGTRIPLIGVDHLLNLKKAAGRNKDMIDIIQLNEIRRIKKI